MLRCRPKKGGVRHDGAGDVRVHYNIRARFGAAGDTMLVMSPETREKLAARRAKGDAAPIDFIGILVRPPAPSAVPNWRRHVYCSLFQGAGQPRWIFEVEELLAR